MEKAILLAAERDRNFTHVARQHHVSRTTVMRIANKNGIRAGGTGGLKIPDDKRAAVVALLPHARNLSAVAAEVGVDYKTVAKIKREEEEKSERQSRQTPPSLNLEAAKRHFSPLQTHNIKGGSVGGEGESVSTDTPKQPLRIPRGPKLGFSHKL